MGINLNQDFRKSPAPPTRGNGVQDVVPRIGLFDTGPLPSFRRTPESRKSPGIGQLSFGKTIRFPACAVMTTSLDP